MSAETGENRWLKGVSVGAIVLAGGLAIGTFSVHEAHVRHHAISKIREQVLQSPGDLARLGICPPELREEATYLRGAAAITYNQVADHEQRVDPNCPDGAQVTNHLTFPSKDADPKLGNLPVVVTRHELLPHVS